MAITSNLERLSRQVMSGIHAQTPKAQEKDVGELVSEFASWSPPDGRRRH